MAWKKAVRDSLRGYSFCFGIEVVKNRLNPDGGRVPIISDNFNSKVKTKVQLLRFQQFCKKYKFKIKCGKSESDLLQLEKKLGLRLDVSRIPPGCENLIK